jgi:hypothetical protein
LRLAVGLAAASLNIDLYSKTQRRRSPQRAPSPRKQTNKQTNKRTDLTYPRLSLPHHEAGALHRDAALTDRDHQTNETKDN